MNGRDRHSGYTLVELLVVMAIIVMLSSVTIPTLIRSGFFSSDKSRTAARDLFAQLRAANLHATTRNVDAAIAYDVDVPQDSLFSGDGNLGTNQVNDAVPTDYAHYGEVSGGNYDSTRVVLTESALVRRLTIEEIGESLGGVSLAAIIINYDPNDEYGSYGNLKNDLPFVPVNNTFGGFQAFPKETCVLTNHPAVLTDGGTPQDDLDTFRSETGLQDIAIFRIFEDSNGYEISRILPKISDGDLTDTSYPDRGLPGDNSIWNNRFPAHVFKKTGGLDTISTKQRLVLSLGLKPDADYYDRYMVNDLNDLLFTENGFSGDASFELVGIETDVIINVVTGRVKVADDDET
ncbi:MAG: prepilin-type N-terminal cleavage/methylation domain-containing protein [Candidatus Hydrogenedentota bacterium]